MRKYLTVLLAVLSLSACSHWDMWTEADSVDTGTGTTDSYIVFTGAAPSSVYATQARYSDSVNISWNSVTGADYYEVYRASASSPTDLPASSASFSYLGLSTSTSYLDGDVEAGSYYAYRVRARSFSQLDVTGSYSSIVSGWTLSPPSGISASKGTSSSVVTISWDESLDASYIKGYRLEWSGTGEDSWAVAVPAGSSASSYIIAPTASSFTFSPDEEYYGLSLYFRLVSVSKNGSSVSSASGTALGYTYDEENAPGTCVVTEVSDGDYTDCVYIAWTLEGEDDGYDWEILRSSESESDVAVLSTLDGDEAPECGSDGVYSYYDQTAEAGIAYSYHVRAIKDSVNGLCESGSDGYVLSPPGVEDGYGIATDESGSYGFQFTLSSAVGEEDHASEWTYRVYGSADESAWSLYTEIEASSEDRTVFYPYDGDGYDCQYFTTTTYNSSLGIESCYLHETSINGGDCISFEPASKPVNFAVSDNFYSSILSADDNGNYPIIATMNEDEDVAYYNIRVWEEEPYSVEDDPDQEFILYPESYSEGVTMLEGVVEDPVTGWTYYVAVQGVDNLGREGDWSDIGSGNCAITDEKLIIIMQAYVTKPWDYIDQPIMTDGPWGSDELNERWKNSKIKDKVKASGLASIGTVTESGLVSGTMYYSTAVTSGSGSSIGGEVNFVYTDYSDVGFFCLDGSCTMNVGLSGSGSTQAEYEITGEYSATVVVASDKMKIVSNESVGVYEVKQKGRSQVDVPVNYNYEGQTI